MKEYIILTLLSAAFATSFEHGFKKIEESFPYVLKTSHSPVFFKSPDPFSGSKVIGYASDDKGVHAQGSFVPKDPTEITIKSSGLVQVAPVKYTIKHSPEVHYYAGFPFHDSSKTDEIKKIEPVADIPKVSFYSGGSPFSIHDKINHQNPILFSAGIPTMNKFDDFSKIGPQMAFKEFPKMTPMVQFYSAGGGVPVVVHQDKMDEKKMLDFAHNVHKGEHEVKKVEEKIDEVKTAPVFHFSEVPGHHAIKPGVQFFSSAVPAVHEIKEYVEEKVPTPIKVVDKVDEHIVKKEPVVTYSSGFGFPSFHAKGHESFIKVPMHSSGWAVKPIEVKPIEVIPYAGGWFHKSPEFPVKKIEEKIDQFPVHYSSGWPFTFTSSIEHKPSVGGSNWFKW